MKRLSTICRVAATAIAAVVIVACSGEVGPPQTADSKLIVTPTSIVETTTTSTTTTAAPTTTVPTTTTLTAPVEAESTTGDDAPDVLAFRTDNLGALYEVDTSGQLLAVAEGAGAGASGETVADGEMVRVLNRTEVLEDVWVQIGRPLGGSPIGWVLAEDLIETDQWVDVVDTSKAGQLVELRNTRILRAEPRPTADATVEAGAGLLAVHSGETALHGTGVTWARIMASEDGSFLGWIEEGELLVINDIVVWSSTGQPVRTSADPSIDYGVQMSGPTVVQSSCSFLRVRIDAGSTAAGTHVLFGPQPPVGTLLIDDEPSSDVAAPAEGEQIEPTGGDPIELRATWNAASGGGAVFISPGESVTFTLPASLSSTWHFVALGLEQDVSFVLDDAGNPSAQGVSTVTTPASC